MNTDNLLVAVIETEPWTLWVLNFTVAMRRQSRLSLSFCCMRRNNDDLLPAVTSNRCHQATRPWAGHGVCSDRLTLNNPQSDPDRDQALAMSCRPAHRWHTCAHSQLSLSSGRKSSSVTALFVSATHVALFLALSVLLHPTLSHQGSWID
jgi:hypothetical protein